MNRSQNGFIMPIILGIIVLLIISGGVYVYQNQSKEKQSNIETILLASSTSSTNPINSSASSTTPVTDWKDYRNDQYGFAFKYSPNWLIEDALAKKANAIVLSNINADIGQPTFLDIKSGKTVPQCSLFAEEISCQVIKNDFGVTYIKAIHTVHVRSGPTTAPLKELSIIVPLQTDSHIEINQLLDDWEDVSLPNMDKFQTDIDRIFSTFKFIK